MQFGATTKVLRKKRKTSGNDAVPHAKEGKDGKGCRGYNQGVDAPMHPQGPWFGLCSASFCAAKSSNPAAGGDPASPGLLAHTPTLGTGLAGLVTRNQQQAAQREVRIDPVEKAEGSSDEPGVASGGDDCGAASGEGFFADLAENFDDQAPVAVDGT